MGSKNISTITLDNASSNDAIVSHLKKRFKTLMG